MKRRGLRQSFSAAAAGLVYAFISQRNMKIHAAAALSAVILGFIFDIQRWEWGFLSVAIFFVLTAETVNTAIEKTVDLITENYHPLAKLAKNLAAGAVLLSAINAVIMAFIIFIPHLFG